MWTLIQTWQIRVFRRSRNLMMLQVRDQGWVGLTTWREDQSWVPSNPLDQAQPERSSIVRWSRSVVWTLHSKIGESLRSKQFLMTTLVRGRSLSWVRRMVVAVLVTWPVSVITIWIWHRSMTIVRAESTLSTVNEIREQLIMMKRLASQLVRMAMIFSSIHSPFRRMIKIPSWPMIIFSRSKKKMMNTWGGRLYNKLLTIVRLTHLLFTALERLKF